MAGLNNAFEPKHCMQRPMKTTKTRQSQTVATAAMQQHQPENTTNPSLLSRIEQRSEWMRKGVEQGWIRPFERSLVAFLEREYGRLSEDMIQAVCLLSLMEGAGHSLLPISMPPETIADQLRLDEEGRAVLALMRIRREMLLDSGLVEVMGRGVDDVKPLLLRGDELSFRRFFQYERDIEQWFRERSMTGTEVDSHRVLEKLNELLPEDGDDEVNWKRVALILSLHKPCLIISGGPGTGKTTTIASMIRLHQELTKNSLRIALAAPTGKAAGRMSESLRNVYDERGWRDDYIDELMSAEAFTLHRLLNQVQTRGLLPSTESRYLPYDLIIVDEASMIDLHLMHRLVRHTAPTTRLILLGDKDQLVSVEAGSVFSDVCTKQSNQFSDETCGLLAEYGIGGLERSDAPPVPGDMIVYLTKSYRFHEHSGIGSLASAIKTNESRRVELQKRFDASDRLAIVPFRYEKEDIAFFQNRFRERVQLMEHQADPNEMIRMWKQEIWLTALRRGQTGSDQLNRMLEESYLSKASAFRRSGWYHGRYVMITQNDYTLGVFNGDTGVCVHMGDGSFRVFIESGSDLKSFHPDRLKEYKPAYFLTVHKSQGSEFSHVRMVLPAEETPVLTKELLYTAVTRSRDQFTLHGDLAMFSDAIQRPAVRFTGLFQPGKNT